MKFYRGFFYNNLDITSRISSLPKEKKQKNNRIPNKKYNIC